MNKKIIILVFSLLLASKMNKLNAQDVIFTQFTEAPLVLNPALAGHFEGRQRLGVLYRNQWATVGKAGAYSTPSAFADFNVLDDNVRGSFGAGISFTNDESAGGKFSNVGANISVAYHFAFDPEEQKNFFSIGIQGGIINQHARVTDFTFASQFNGEKIDPTLPVGETNLVENVLTPDLSLGIVWASYFGNGSHFKVGGSYKHLLTQIPSFQGTQNSFLPSLLVGHAELGYQLSPFFSLNPRALYAVQGKATQLQAQLLAGLHFKPTTALFIGGGVRTGDAITANLRLQLDKVTIGLGYDISNNPMLQSATRGQGAWELSLIYSGGGSGNGASTGKATTPPKRYF